MKLFQLHEKIPDFDCLQFSVLSPFHFTKKNTKLLTPSYFIENITEISDLTCLTIFRQN